MAPVPRPTQLHIETPLLYSSLLSKRTNAHIYLKLENTQPSGSFKTRGIGALALASITSSTPFPHLVCSSGGNAGLACAYAAQALSLPCTIFVPLSTKASVLERIRGYGAKVVQGGAHWAEADKGARELVETEGDAVYVPPFDHPKVVEGHATMVVEVEEQLRKQGRKADAVICSVGGGGLLAGILTGLASSGSSIPVLACETFGAASFAASIEASFASNPPTPRLERLDGIKSVATTLGATAVSMTALTLAVEHPAGVVSVVTEDARAIAAVRSFASDHGFFVEPACAVSLVPLYFPEVLWTTLPTLFGEEAEERKDLPVVVVVVCGGNTFALEALEAWEAEHGRGGEGGRVRTLTRGKPLVLANRP